MKDEILCMVTALAVATESSEKRTSAVSSGSMGAIEERTNERWAKQRFSWKFDLADKQTYC